MAIQFNNNLTQEVNPMQTQTVEFAVTRDKGNITRVGRTGILQPKTKFKGGFVKWYEDKPKQKSK